MVKFIPRHEIQWIKRFSTHFRVAVDVGQHRGNRAGAQIVVVRPSRIDSVERHVLYELGARDPLLQFAYWDAEVEAELEPESPLGAATEFFIASSTAVGTIPLSRMATSATRSRATLLCD